MQTEARASSPPESLSQEQRASYVFLTVVTVISLAADLASKGWAKARLTGFDPQKLAPKKIEIIKDHLDFIYALNPASRRGTQPCAGACRSRSAARWGTWSIASATGR
jgi:hypothetical protein